jgi:ABC-type lipoprotein export system ATPase subunit
MLVLADEPTGNLDQVSAQTVAKLLLEVPQEENAVLVVVTHSTSLAAQMQQCFELNHGRLSRIAALPS